MVNRHLSVKLEGALENNLKEGRPPLGPTYLLVYMADMPAKVLVRLVCMLLV
jgi:hypothetical protein